jgi:hypothetical protein
MIPTLCGVSNATKHKQTTYTRYCEGAPDDEPAAADALGVALSDVVVQLGIPQWSCQAVAKWDHVFAGHVKPII